MKPRLPAGIEFLEHFKFYLVKVQVKTIYSIRKTYRQTFSVPDECSAMK